MVGRRLPPELRTSTGADGSRDLHDAAGAGVLEALHSSAHWRDLDYDRLTRAMGPRTRHDWDNEVTLDERRAHQRRIRRRWQPRRFR
jgi:hypothetical protein